MYAKYEPNGKLKPRTDWYKAPINYEALDLLKASNDDKDMFSSLVNKLEAEITKFIDIGYGTNKSFDLTELQNSIESIVSDKDTAEFWHTASSELKSLRTQMHRAERHLKAAQSKWLKDLSFRRVPPTFLRGTNTVKCIFQLFVW